MPLIGELHTLLVIAPHSIRNSNGLNNEHLKSPLGEAQDFTFSSFYDSLRGFEKLGLVYGHSTRPSY